MIVAATKASATVASRPSERVAPPPETSWSVVRFPPPLPATLSLAPAADASGAPAAAAQGSSPMLRAAGDALLRAIGGVTGGSMAATYLLLAVGGAVVAAIGMATSRAAVGAWRRFRARRAHDDLSRAWHGARLRAVGEDGFVFEGERF